MVTQPNEENTTNNDDLSYQASLRMVGGEGGSLSSGLSTDEGNADFTAAENSTEEIADRIPLVNDHSNRYVYPYKPNQPTTTATITNEPRELMASFPAGRSPGKDKNIDFGSDVTPSLQRRMTERASNNAMRSSNESGGNETDYLLKGVKKTLKNERIEYHFEAVVPTDDGRNQRKITLESIKTTISGSVMFILFHILFSLAQASAIHRPHSKKSVLGQMTRMSALGPIVAGPIYVWVLGDQFPALYPTIDAFVAPFLVQQATIVDQMLYENGLEDDENLFMTTFCVLSGLGLIFTGLFLFIGTKFKLANLGAYLPYPVMAGFFSTVGFLGWTLAFSVDTGKNIGEVIRDADWNETKHCLIHHIPSVVLGLSISIFISGPRKSWTPLFVLGTIPVVFTIMLFTGTTLDEARQDGWFWKKEEFESVSDSSIYDYNSGDGFSWNPPLPFGVFVGVLRGNVYLPAIVKGLPVSLAMGLMYLLRCSLHVPALQKNSETLLKWAEDQELQIRAMKSKEAIKSPTLENYENVEDRLRTFSEESCYNQDADEIENNQVSKVEKKAHSVSDIYVWYGKCLCISGLAGGSATIPSMGASITLFKMGARGKAPQYGSIILLVFFYTNKFELVGYFPRIVFSTLLFVSSTDLLNNWFVLSYQKTADRGEWLIVPILSLFAFVVGVLPAVAFGMALSTILFVGTFYKSGVVKFISTGKTVHSTTERNVDDAEWLDFNGDLIQVMVIQNYLFFGNANTLKSFVSKMFHKAENSASFPKYLIMDLSLVTGMDTSAVEIFSDIVTLCYGNKCQVFLAGLSQRLTYTMRRGGVIPSSDKMSKFSILRLPPTMESALMKAEDGLLKFEFKTEEREMRHCLERNKSDKDGFLHTLELINQKQRISIALNLKGLLPYTKRLSLAAGESLLHNLDGSDNARERGLFFIEQGIMRVERDAHANLTRTGNTFNSITSFNDSMRNDSSVSLTKLKDAWVKELSLEDKRNVRIARIGSGWVLGVLEDVYQTHDLGFHIAVTPCRLHHLPHSAISKLEKVNPALMLELFKMMSWIATRRHEYAVSQLVTLQTIMSAPPPTEMHRQQ